MNDKVNDNNGKVDDNNGKVDDKRVQKTLNNLLTLSRKTLKALETLVPVQNDKKKKRSNKESDEKSGSFGYDLNRKFKARMPARTQLPVLKSKKAICAKCKKSIKK